MSNITENKSNSNKIISFAIYLISSVALIAVDKITKMLAVNNLKDSQPYVLIKGVFELRYLENRGAAFGMLQNQIVFFVAGALLVTLASAYVYYKTPLLKKYNLIKVICVLLTAGAIGNLIDRITNNYVIDFFYFVLIDFPIFNVADCYVVVGSIVLAIAILWIYKDGDFEFLRRK